MDFGDGSLIYPGTELGLNGPVSSIRLEQLTDGIEDYEYFVMLKRLLAERRNLPSALRDKAAALLKVPPSVYSSMTEFTTDPEPMEKHREKLAHMIEEIF